ncbi:protein DpdE [Streptomyces sp. NPDC057284]|uniref:protein DpdE n=1 Tax=Streptomyces sp. NPDC057284 TaxID=3346083 RepID=UPI003628D207
MPCCPSPRTCRCAPMGRLPAPGGVGRHRIPWRPVGRACASAAPSTRPTRRGRAPAPAAEGRPLMDNAVLCPVCGAGMKLQFASRGSNAGNCFWGCSRFPQCRGSRNVDTQEAEGATTRPRAASKSRPVPRSRAPRTSLKRGDLLVSSANALGPGKLVARNGDDLVLEYFDTPGQDPDERHRQTVPRQSLKRLTLPPELRVFWLADAQWRSGRIIETTPQRDIYVRGRAWEGHLPEERLHVRWDCPLTDPVGFASAGLLESPLLADVRRPFLQSTLEQRSAAHGMRGALSSCIELYEHQIETVWRVLQDPVQRYLLADEVGLGKTIEAGLVIRELLLDNPHLAVQLVLPPFLVEQWRRELISKFRIHEFPNARIAFSRDDEPQTWERADLVVVDEAHNLARLADSQQQDLSARYARLAEVATASPRLMLLSATPALHNERSFLAMLKLLDPAVYRDTTVDELRGRLEARSRFGRLFLGLQPGLPGILLKRRLTEIGAEFSGDAEVTTLIAGAMRDVEERDKDALTTAITSLRTHISEVHRVHRRMLRTRRTAALEASYRVTGRLRPEPIVLESPAVFDVARLLDNWRQEALAAREFDEEARREAASALATAVSLSLDPDGLRLWARTRVAATHGEQDALDRIDGDLRFVSRQSDISRPLADALTYQIGARERAVIFCPTPHMASELADELRKLLPGQVLQHLASDPPAASEEAIRTFERTRSGCVLVADSSAEEGRNLQFADLLIHVGLPPRANRLEQRIGRCDRWDVRREGGGAWRSYQVAETADARSFAAAWTRILTEGFAVFDTSVASLQHAVDAATDTAWHMLFDQGVNATHEAIETVRAVLEGEVERVREQDALDSIEAPTDERSVYGRMMAFEEQVSSFADVTDALLSSRRSPGNLRFAPVGDPVHTTGSYEPISRPPSGLAQIPLVPVHRLQRDFLPLREHRGTFVRTLAVEHEEVRLYRYGDQFIDAVSDFLWNDDRGRAFGMWRWLPDWPRAERLVYRFDYAIEANPLEVTSEADRLDQLTAEVVGEALDRPSLRRRADGVFPPLIVTVWMDGDGTPLSDERHLDALTARYTKPAPGSPGGDYALNRERIKHAYELVPAQRWGQRWREAERGAQRLVRGDQAVRAACSRALAIAETDIVTRLRQLGLRAARSQGNERAFLEKETRIESLVGQALTAAIRTPSLRLDSTGVVVVSGRGLEQDGYA